MRVGVVFLAQVVDTRDLSTLVARHGRYREARLIASSTSTTEATFSPRPRCEDSRHGAGKIVLPRPHRPHDGEALPRQYSCQPIGAGVFSMQVARLYSPRPTA